MPEMGRLAIIVALMVSVVSSEVLAQEQNLLEQQTQSSQELDELRDEIALSEQRKEELSLEIEGLEKDRATLNRKLIESSAKARKLEKNASRTESRLTQLREQQENIRISLLGRKALLSEILGALQRMGRNPPPALLVRPEDALASVRSAILLGAVIPEVRAETEVLVTELNELVRISSNIEIQWESLRTDLSELAVQEERLSLLLVEKQKFSSEARTEIAKEGARVAELAARATSLNSLIESLEVEIESVREAAEEARLAEEERRKQEAQRIAEAREAEPDEKFGDAGRIAPAISFDAAKGLLPLPVHGVQSANYGKSDSSGDVSKGISLATRPNARVISPADGWVVYSGPFRSYGQLLILNAGDGYHIVLAGLDKMSVELGQFILMGEPIGVMGEKRLASAASLDVASTRPILYVEFRKGDQPIDPTPWWADSNVKRAVNDS